MSKLSSLSASSRLRSKKENSLAAMKPTKKKSLNSSLSTAVSQRRKAIGKLMTVIHGFLVKDYDPTLESLAEILLNLVQKIPVDHKLALLTEVARLLKDEKSRSILELLRKEQPPEKKPWQHEG